MKKIILVLAVVTALVSCKSKDSISPTAAVEGMFTAMKSGNIDEMKKYITKSDVALLEAAESFVSAVNPEAVKKVREKMAEEFKEKAKDISYKLKNEKISGDNATVEVEVTKDGKTKSDNLNLVKEDGTWKIALSKSGDGMFNSMKGNRGADDKPDLREGVERLQKMDPDSLKKLVDRGMQAWDSLSKSQKKN